MHGIRLDKDKFKKDASVWGAGSGENYSAVWGWRDPFGVTNALGLAVNSTRIVAACAMPPSAAAAHPDTLRLAVCYPHGLIRVHQLGLAVQVSHSSPLPSGSPTPPPCRPGLPPLPLAVRVSHPHPSHQLGLAVQVSHPSSS